MLNDQVEKVLSLYPDTRSNDTKLCARVLAKYYGFDYEAVVNTLAEVNPNSVSRARRKIQAQEKDGVLCQNQ